MAELDDQKLLESVGNQRATDGMVWLGKKVSFQIALEGIYQQLGIPLYEDVVHLRL